MESGQIAPGGQLMAQRNTNHKTKERKKGKKKNKPPKTRNPYCSIAGLTDICCKISVVFHCTLLHTLFKDSQKYFFIVTWFT